MQLHGVLAQLARALDWQSKGQGFDSPILHRGLRGKICHGGLSAKIRKKNENLLNFTFHSQI